MGLPRIVIYTETTSRGGAEVSLRNLVAALRTDLDITVMCVDREIGEWIANGRFRTEVAVVPAIRNKASVAAFLAHRRAIAARRPAIFHANLRTMGDAQYALIAASAVRGVPVIAVEQLPFPPATRLSRRLKQLTSRRLARHVAVGHRAARLVEETCGLPPNSIETIYNGVPDLGVPAAVSSRRVPVIGSLARLDHIKGLDVLLDAMAGLPTVEVIVAGEGPDRAALVTKVHALGLDDRVRFLPWADDARRYLAEMDVFVLPSRNEGFPLSIVEAMLAGLPVVATDVGSVSEAVVDGETGFVVAPDDADALRAALSRLLDDPGLRATMGRAGRDRALASFTDTTMARAFEALYESIAARG